MIRIVGPANFEQIERAGVWLESPGVIEATSCNRKHLFYWDYLLLSETPLVIEATSCYRTHLLLSKGIFVRLRASQLAFQRNNMKTKKGDSKLRPVDSPWAQMLFSSYHILKHEPWRFEIFYACISNGSVANDQPPGRSCKFGAEEVLHDWKYKTRHLTVLFAFGKYCSNSWSIGFSLSFFCFLFRCFINEWIVFLPPAGRYRICHLCPDLPLKDGSRHAPWFYLTFIFCFWQTWRMEIT